MGEENNEKSSPDMTNGTTIFAYIGVIEKSQCRHICS